MTKPRRNVRKAAVAARTAGPAVVTCPASRHVHLMAEALWKGQPYPMLAEEPKHCAESLFAVVKALWEARQKLAALPSTGPTDPKS